MVLKYHWGPQVMALRYTLISVTWSGHVKYMVSPFFYFYMTTYHVLKQ